MPTGMRERSLQSSPFIYREGERDQKRKIIYLKIISCMDLSTSRGKRCKAYVKIYVANVKASRIQVITYIRQLE